MTFQRAKKTHPFHDSLALKIPFHVSRKIGLHSNNTKILTRLYDCFILSTSVTRVCEILHSKHYTVRCQSQ
jgi:hypothetical protein